LDEIQNCSIKAKTGTIKPLQSGGTGYLYWGDELHLPNVAYRFELEKGNAQINDHLCLQLLSPMGETLRFLNISEHEGLTFGDIKPRIAEILNIFSNEDFGRCLFNKNPICPAAQLIHLGFDFTRPNEICVVRYMGAGLAPPSTTLKSIGYSSTNLKSDVKLEAMCPSSKHQRRVDQKCLHCGKLPYKKPFFANGYIPICSEGDRKVSVFFEFFRDEKSDEIYQAKLKRIDDRVLRVTDSSGALVKGKYKIINKWTIGYGVPTLRWRAKSRLPDGFYNVWINEDAFEFSGEKPPTLGVTEFTFQLKYSPRRMGNR
jgi:hypothetical protein